MSAIRRHDHVLALYPFTRGFAFTLFESPMSLLEWGVKDVRGNQKNALALEATKRLIERLQPDILVLQNFLGLHPPRAARIRRLQRLIEGHALSHAIEVHKVSRQQIRDCFESTGALTRYEIAQAIASHVHPLGHRLPPTRKIWKSEDCRMSLFDAASLALTFYGQDKEGYLEAA